MFTRLSERLKSGPLRGAVEVLNQVTDELDNGRLSDSQLSATYASQLSALGVGDETARINAWLAAPSPMGIKRMVGAFSISDALTVPSETNLDGTGATITQTSDHTPTLVIDNVENVSLAGFTLIGKATDYVPGAGISAATGILIRDSTGVTVRDTIVVGHAGVGIKLQDCTESGVFTNRVTGTNPPAGDGSWGAQCCILLEGDCSTIQVIGNWVTKSAQGICASVASVKLQINDNMIWDITGQHGIYIQNGTDTQVNGNWVMNCAYSGIKCQIYDGSPADSYGLQVIGNTVSGTGSHAILIANTGEASSPDFKYVNAQIMNNNVRDTPNEGIHLTTMWHSRVEGNVIRDARNGIMLNWGKYTSVSHNTISLCTASGIAVDSSDEVGVRFNRVTDVGTANVNTTEFGIRTEGIIGSSTNLVFEGNTVIDTLGNMRYGIYTPYGDQTTFSFIGNRVVGATDYGVRLQAAKVRAWRDNDVNGGSGAILNFPSDLSDGSYRRVVLGAAAPTTGTWNRGDRVENPTPSAGGFLGWVCTAGGTPGTWKTFGAITA